MLEGCLPGEASWVLKESRLLTPAGYDLHHGMTWSMGCAAQVKRAEMHMLNRLFAHVHGLSEPELKRLLEEDDNTIKRRSAAKCVHA